MYDDSLHAAGWLAQNAQKERKNKEEAANPEIENHSHSGAFHFNILYYFT